MPNKDRNTSVMAPLAALNRGFSKKCMSSIGCFERSSQMKNNPIRTAPTTKPVMISLDVQPWLGASITAHRSEPSPAIDNVAPTGSSAACDGSRDSGMNR